MRAPDGFTVLFNGKDLTGWRGRPGKGGVFSPYVEEAFTDAERKAKQAEWNADRDLRWWVDEARGELVTDGKGVHLATEKQYGNFEMLAEWKLTVPGGITGIYLRTPRGQVVVFCEPHQQADGFVPRIGSAVEQQTTTTPASGRSSHQQANPHQTMPIQ